MMTWLKVTKEEHAAFVAAYPRKLTVDVSYISEPPQKIWYDFNAKNSNCLNSYVAAEHRDWLGPNGEIDEGTRFWTYSICIHPLHTGIAKKVKQTLDYIGLVSFKN